MATYTPILASELDADSPITATLMGRLSDNPIATAEGASGAPRVQGIALGGVVLGAVDIAGTATTAFTGLDRAGFIVVQGQSRTASTWALLVEFSNDNGGSWGAVQSIGTVIQDREPINAAFSMQTGVGYQTNNSTPALTLTVPSNANAIRFSGSAGGADGVILVLCLGGLE